MIAGPGLQSTAAPWKPEYAHLSQRVAEMKLPPTGNEKFHIHAMLHIYKDGLLIPVPADIGIDTAKHTETSLHTHDLTGVIHMEAPHPFQFTLGDFFKVWGVALGPEQVGNLHGYGGDHLHFYVNGKPLANPAAYVLHRRDSIVIGYGPASSFPHTPGHADPQRSRRRQGRLRLLVEARRRQSEKLHGHGHEHHRRHEHHRHDEHRGTSTGTTTEVALRCAGSGARGSRAGRLRRLGARAVTGGPRRRHGCAGLLRPGEAPRVAGPFVAVVGLLDRPFEEVRHELLLGRASPAAGRAGLRPCGWAGSRTAAVRCRRICPSPAGLSRIGPPSQT